MTINLGADIDVYPVGLLSDLSYFVHHPDRTIARRRLRSAARTLRGRVRRRQWRALKNYFNGYLAEPRVLPPGFRRGGTGWTRGRAWRDLQRHLAEVDDGAYQPHGGDD